MQLVRPGTLLRTQAKQAAGCLDPEPHCPQPDSNVQPTNAAHWIWIWPSRSGAEGTELRGRRGRRRREWDLLEAAGRDAGEVEGGGRCGGEERRGRERERHRGPAEHRRRPHGWGPGGARRLVGGSEAEVSQVATPTWKKTLSLAPSSLNLPSALVRHLNRNRPTAQ